MYRCRHRFEPQQWHMFFRMYKSFNTSLQKVGGSITLHSTYLIRVGLVRVGEKNIVRRCVDKVQTIVPPCLSHLVWQVQAELWPCQPRLASIFSAKMHKWQIPVLHTPLLSRSFIFTFYRSSRDYTEHDRRVFKNQALNRIKIKKHVLNRIKIKKHVS